MDDIKLVGALIVGRILRKGRQRLFLHPDCEGDGASPTQTPGKLRKVHEVDRLEKVSACC